MKIWFFVLFFNLIISVPFYDGLAAKHPSDPSAAATAEPPFSPALNTGVKIAPTAPTADTNTDTTSEVEKKLWAYSSLMFDKKTSEWIAEAIKSHDQQIPLEILLPSLFPPAPVAGAIVEDKKEDKLDEGNKDKEKKPDSPTEAPVFYLKSILYFSPDNWSVWINDTKISDKTDNKFGNLTIVKVSRDDVIFLWQNTQIDKITPNWRNAFIPLDNDKFASPGKNIVVDNATGNISFILKINQSLVSKSFEIIEGPEKATSLTQTATQTNSTGVKSIAPDAATGTQTPDPADLLAESNALEKNTINTLDSLKNIEILKSLLDQNVEKLRE